MSHIRATLTTLEGEEYVIDHEANADPGLMDFIYGNNKSAETLLAAARGCLEMAEQEHVNLTSVKFEFAEGEVSV